MRFRPPGRRATTTVLATIRAAGTHCCTARQIELTMGLRAGSQPTLAADRLNVHRRADQLALYVKVSDPGGVLDALHAALPAPSGHKAHRPVPRRAGTPRCGTTGRYTCIIPATAPGLARQGVFAMACMRLALVSITLLPLRKVWTGAHPAGTDLTQRLRGAD